jgi:hypothetical protein
MAARPCANLEHLVKSVEALARPAYVLHPSRVRPPTSPLPSHVSFVACGVNCHHGTSKMAALHRYGFLKSVCAPATPPGTGNRRAVSGLFSLKASAAISWKSAAIFSAGTSPATAQAHPRDACAQERCGHVMHAPRGMWLRDAPPQGDVVT